MVLKKWSELIIKFRWIVIVFWIVIAAIVVWKAPTLSEVAKSSQESFLPGETDSIKASKLLKELYDDKDRGGELIITFNRKEGIGDRDGDYVRKLEQYLRNNNIYRITGIVSPFTQKEMQDVMISKDRQAAFIVLKISTPGYSEQFGDIIHTIRSDIQQTGNISSNGIPSIPQALNVNVTGDSALIQEQKDTMHKSMEITGGITIILVAAVLIIIYRSPIAPLLPLATIGLSFLISRGVVAYATSFGLKISSFTETFLVAILFGAGTDYCLLIISRFREEISIGKTVKEALKATIPNVGEAVVSSGGTVMVGFAFMVFAKFGLFNTTGPSIAVGVGITLLAVMTFTPALIAVLGERIFWPGRPSRVQAGERKESSLWGRLANSVTSRPIRFIVLCLVVFIPFAVMVKNAERSYDQISELPSASDPVKGFQVIKDHFDQGEMLPVKVVIKTDENMWSNESLQVLERLTADILKIDTVAKVRTATRPAGDKLTQVSLSKQIETLSEGVETVKGGVAPVIAGMNEVQGGVKKVAEGISKGSSGLSELAGSTKKTADGIASIDKGMQNASAGQQSAIDGIVEVSDSLGRITTGITGSKDGVDKVYEALQNTQQSLEAIMAQQPKLAMDINFQTAYGTVKKVVEDIPKISSGLGQSSEGLVKSQTGLNTTQKGLSEIKSGINRSSAALKNVLAGVETIGNKQAESSKQLAAAASNLEKIALGIDDGKDGLKKMEGGLGEIHETTSGYTSKGKELDGFFYLPEGVLEEYPKLKEAMGTYITKSGNGVTLDIVLTIPPYTAPALDSIAEIRNAVKNSLKGSHLESAEFHIGGATSVFSEIREVTADDFVVVMVCVLAGIFVVLVILLRSIIAPIYLIVTILLSFATTMGITYLVFQVGMGHEGLSWSVPFFSFCLLVALGVDYNIFLMSRVKEEYKPGDVTGGITRALSSTGGIITSCGIIMAGTFGALIASPMSSLMEVGFATVVGLLLDTFIIRCLLVPAIAVKVGELNWWPGRKVRIVPVEAKEN